MASSRPLNPLCLLTIAGSLGVLASSASAQNALGDGRAHDANLQQGGSRYNAPGRNSNIAQEVRFRNSIVTGNAPGGMSFRGDAGYLSTDDFSAPVGSDSLFAFQRDSLFSGLASRGVRGVDALRAQMALSTGGAPTYGTSELFISRAGGMSSGADFRRDAPQLTIDPFTTRAGSLRSSSTFLSSQSLEPQFFGSLTDQSGRAYAIGSSSLRGVIAQPLMREESLVDPGSMGMPGLPGIPDQQQPGGAQDAAGNPLGEGSDATSGLRFEPDAFGAMPSTQTRPGEEGDERTGRPGQIVTQPQSGRVNNSVTPGRVGSQTLTNRVTARTPYESILQQMAVPAETPDTPEAAEDAQRPADPRAIPDFDPQAIRDGQAAPEQTEEDRRKFTEKLEDLRREMLGLPPAEREEPSDAPPQVDDEGNPIPVQPRSDAGVRSIRERAAEFFGEGVVNLDSLSTKSSDVSQYNQYMREGERLLQQERWFDAEEAFTRAINRRNGDPIAAAGRINAQLGAAMYLSASVNLRTLFSAHPEMAGVRFSDDLFLRGRRLDQVIAYLRDEAAKDRPFGREAALLLAFIGHQRSDSREVRNAFNAIDRINTEFPGNDDPITELLKGAWLDAPAARDQD